ncbi:TPA: hypothetical protein ACH3X1_005883 [Trebouxia sp. C0004]
MVAVMCSALLLHPVAAYNFNFGGGNYGQGIHDSASYYRSHGMSQGQYRSDLSGALHHSGASAAAASSGFSNAMAQALEGRDYGTYGYSCAGAIGFGSKGSWTTVLTLQAKSHGFSRGDASAAAAATSGGQYGGDVGSATAAAAASAFGSSAAAAASSSGRKLLSEPILV